MGYSGKFDGKGLKYTFAAYNNKFQMDKVDYEDQRYVVNLDGCILNLQALMQAYKADSTKDLLVKLWETHQCRLIRVLKGSYDLVIYDKAQEELLVTNDWLSKRPLYYQLAQGKLCYSSRFSDLLALLAGENAVLSFDKIAFGMMLKDGFLGGDRTYIKQVSYLKRYEYLHAKGGMVSLQALQPATEKLEWEEERLLEEFEKRFTQAVALQFEKNQENGYTQLVTLSGGMDSRSCVLTADKLGYHGLRGITYSQSDSVDFRVSSQIARDLNIELLFYQLDSALFLTQPMPRIARNECAQSYCGATGAYAALRALDLTKVGIVHTGSLGGELMGDLLGKREQEDDLAYFRSEDCGFIGEQEIASFLEQSSDPFAFALEKNTRCTQNIFRMMEDQAEAFSPFLDEDLYEYSLRIPEALLSKRAFYKKWMSRYLPNPYASTATFGKIGENKWVCLLKKVYYQAVVILRKKNRYSMNPYAYWLQHNKGLQGEMNLLFEGFQKECGIGDDAFLQAVQRCYQRGGLQEGIAITALAAAAYCQESFGGAIEWEGM